MDTASIYSRVHDRVDGRIQAVYLAVYTAVKRPCTQPYTRLAHGRVQVYTARMRIENCMTSHYPMYRICNFLPNYCDYTRKQSKALTTIFIQQTTSDKQYSDVACHRKFIKYGVKRDLR